MPKKGSRNAKRFIENKKSVLFKLVFKPTENPKEGEGKY